MLTTPDSDAGMRMEPAWSSPVAISTSPAATGAPDPVKEPPGVCPQAFIAGSNLTSTKARMLLMACLLRFGSLPPAKDPENPTADELAATRKAVAAYQSVFNTH